MSRPTLDTVAAAAGVSRMTVSNCYNRPDQVSAATRERVLAVAQDLGYAGPDPAAASLRLRRSGTVGVVLTEQLPYAFTDPGLVTILHGIATGLSEAGSALLLVPASGADGQSLLRHAIIDALVLCSLDAQDPAVTAAVARRLPLVTVGTPRLPDVPRIGPDNARATGALAEHLLALGHRRFAVVTTVTNGPGGSPRPLFGERVTGFRQAVVRAGLAADDVTVVSAADNSRDAGRATAAELLHAPAGDRPTALFAVTDILALGALDAAAAAGLAVPRDLSVAGFDDIAAAQDAGLTTVSHEMFRQGREAARTALRLAAGEPARAPRIRAQVVPRSTTGPAPRPRKRS